jgi:predicted 3-demethylubiquinone-9 3-methyltransferase (glyoxalase superfamily)
MPNQDIERVINKHKYNTEPEFRKAISKKCQYIKDKWGISIKP